MDCKSGVCSTFRSLTNPRIQAHPADTMPDPAYNTANIVDIVEFAHGTDSTATESILDMTYVFQQCL